MTASNGHKCSLYESLQCQSKPTRQLSSKKTYLTIFLHFGYLISSRHGSNEFNEQGAVQRQHLHPPKPKTLFRINKKKIALVISGRFRTDTTVNDQAQLFSHVLSRKMHTLEAD